VPGVRGLGTLINLVTVGVGGAVGVYLGHRFPERMQRTMMQGLGLATLGIAIVGLEPLLDADLGLRRAVIAIGAITLGAIVGEALILEERLERVGERLRERFAPEDEAAAIGGRHSRFVEGFVVASTVFCAGPLTLLGALEDGLGVSIRLLSIKSTLDGIAAIGFASVYGWGVLGSLLTIAVYQGAVTALAVVIDPIVTEEVVAQLGAIGSLLVMGIGLRLLEIKDIKVVTLTPALVLGPLAAGIFEAVT
jgi:uncharacterized protein